MKEKEKVKEKVKEPKIQKSIPYKPSRSKTISITITGNKKDGYVLKIIDNTSVQDIAIKYEELETIIRLLKNKLK